MSHLDLHARGLSFCYDDHPVLRDADLDVPGGSRVALLGANGSGKTTLLRCISGALEPSAGTVDLGGRRVRYDRNGLRAHRRTVQLVLQDPDDQLFSADVWRDVSFGPVNLGLPEQLVRERVDEALSLLRIGDLADRPVHRLSYGQRKKVTMAGAMAMRPCLLLLDEPTAGLDPAGVAEMLAALARLERQGTTVVIATHDVDLALSWADEVAVVVDARVIQGHSADLLGDRDLVKRARLRLPWVLELVDRLGLRGHGGPGDSGGGDPPGGPVAPVRDVTSLAALIARSCGGRPARPSRTPDAGRGKPRELQ